MFRQISSILLIVITVILNKAAFAHNKNNCRIIELTDNNFQNEYLGIMHALNTEIEGLIINYEGGNFSKTMQLANLLSKSNIAVIIKKDGICINDCSALFFSARRRFSEIAIYFPSYSKNEIDIIKFLKPYQFYSVIKLKSVFNFLSSNYSYKDLKILQEAYENPSSLIRESLNTLSLTEKNHILKNCIKISKFKKNFKSFKTNN